MKVITQAWFERAQDDLDTIEALLNNTQLTNIVAFHAQQAVEKSFKAVIEELGLTFIKTHSLVRLYTLVQPHCAVVQNGDMLDRLDAVYIEARYPGELGLLPYGKPILEEAAQFYAFAKTVYQTLKTSVEQ